MDHDSFTGSLAYDASRRLLYAADLANRRIVSIKPGSGRVPGSAQLSGKPVAQALSPDGRILWVVESESLCVLSVGDAGGPQLRIPPLNLYDATASDLRDLFTLTTDFGAYSAQQPDARILPAPVSTHN